MTIRSKVILSTLILTGPVLMGAPPTGSAMTVADLDELYSESLYAPKGQTDPAPKSFESVAVAALEGAEFDALNLVNELAGIEMRGEQASDPGTSPMAKQSIASRAAHRTRSEKLRRN